MTPPATSSATARTTSPATSPATSRLTTQVTALATARPATQVTDLAPHPAADSTTDPATSQVTARVNREGGSAVVEFVTLGVLLMVPLVYLVLAMARVQAASFAADGSARAAARAYVTAANEAEADRRSVLAVRLGLQDQGFRADDGALAIECGRVHCLTPGARVVARVKVEVVLPGMPRSIGRALSTEVTVRSAQVVAVDEFRSFGPGS